MEWGQKGVSLIRHPNFDLGQKKTGSFSPYVRTGPDHEIIDVFLTRFLQCLDHSLFFIWFHISLMHNQCQSEIEKEIISNYYTNIFIYLNIKSLLIKYLLHIKYMFFLLKLQTITYIFLFGYIQAFAYVSKRMFCNYFIPRNGT